MAQAGRQQNSYPSVRLEQGNIMDLVQTGNKQQKQRGRRPVASPVATAILSPAVLPVRLLFYTTLAGG